MCRRCRDPDLARCPSWEMIPHRFHSSVPLQQGLNSPLHHRPHINQCLECLNTSRATQTLDDAAPFPGPNVPRAHVLQCFDAPRENNGPHPSSLVGSRLALGTTWQWMPLRARCSPHCSLPAMRNRTEQTWELSGLGHPPVQWAPSIDAPRKPLLTFPGLNAIRSEAIPLSRFWWGANRPCACSHHDSSIFFLFLGVESDSQQPHHHPQSALFCPASCDILSPSMTPRLRTFCREPPPLQVPSLIAGDHLDRRHLQHVAHMG